MYGRRFLLFVLAGALAGVGCSARGGGGGGGLPDTDSGGGDDATSNPLDTGNPTGPDVQPTTCPAPRVMCGTTCADLGINPFNCGGCGMRCASGQTCTGGSCVGGSTCTAPRALCNGACTDISSDPSNCGGCGNVCNAGEQCTGGTCTGGGGCASPRVMCGTACTDINSDLNNCGVCGLRCTGGQRCASGTCTGGSTCAAPRVMCGSVCTSLGSDPTNCGTCGRRCATGQACVSGTCSTGGTGTTLAGARCTSDAQCGGMTCDTTVAGGWCSSSCTETGGAESSMCGGGPSTCLSIGDTMPSSFCTRTCTPGAVGEAAGGCRSGMVCTGWWYSHAMAVPDATGCFPFCQSSADCGAGAVCNVRTGSCAAASVPTRLADGSPCDPTSTVPIPGDPMGRSENIQCRGLCFQVGMGATQGMCGSFLNIAVSTTCPDNPTVVQPRAPMGDALALCLFRSCTSTAACPSGLTCLSPAPGSPMICSYP